MVAKTEYEINVFDNNGDHSEPLDHTVAGSSEVAIAVNEFVREKKWENLAIRIVIERVM